MTFDDHLKAALGEVQLSNAHRINAIRAVGSGLFAGSIVLLNLGFGIDSRETIMLPTAIYFVVALFIFVAGRSNEAIARFSRFAVPYFDMPVVFAIQMMNLNATEQKGLISEFSLALFVCLIMLSTFTLDVRQILLSVALAITFEQILQYAAGIEIGGRIFSTAVFAIATWICVFAGRNRVELVKTVSNANARRERLQRYFSPGVGAILEETEDDALTKGKECALSIIFVDIRGFTELSDRLACREVVELLNAYHTHMVEAVFHYGGTLDKYLGDGLIAYFNAPVGQPDHAERAIRCALAMEKELAKLNSELESQGKSPIEIGIGIHTGQAIVGDIGAPHRREFTAIGSAVNVASRLESMTKEIGTGIVVSESTKELIGETDWNELGRFPIRGVAQPMTLFSPVRQETERHLAE